MGSTLRDVRRAALLCGLALTGGLQAQQVPGGGLNWQSGDLSVQAGVDANAYYYGMRGTWWGLAAASAPSFNTDRSYAELWLHPRLNASYAFNAEQQLYAGLSLGITQDIGSNAFDYRDQGATRLENAFLGYRGGSREAWHYDFSAGSQPFTLGSGMLLHGGAINGNEWGNAASYKRLAWKETAIARLGYRDLKAQAFWLDPNEVPTTESKTRLAGASLEWANARDGKAGLAYIHVLKSDFFYPGSLAPFAYLDKGREGLDVYHAWSDLTGLFGAIPALSVRGEFAAERGQVTRVTGQRDDLEAYAWYLGGSYWFQALPLAPKLTYGYAYFSGDKPGTGKYERFDPLFWGNGLDNWWFGANGAYAYINSNLKFHRLTLDGYFSQQDIVKLQYVRADAAELHSPIQFGQAVRFGSGSPLPAVGVDSKHLSDEFMLQYVHVFKPTLVFSTYITHSIPGEGFRALATSGSKNWTTVGMGLTASY